MNMNDFINNNAQIDLYKEAADFCWTAKCKYASSELFSALLLNRKDVQEFLADRGIKNLDIIAKGLLEKAQRRLIKSASYALGNQNDPLANQFTRKATEILKGTGHDISQFGVAKRALEKNEEVQEDKKAFIQTIRYCESFEEAMEDANIAAQANGKIGPGGVDILKEVVGNTLATLGLDFERYGITEELVRIDDEFYLNEQEKWKPEFRSDAVNEALRKRETSKKFTSAANQDVQKLPDEFIAQLKLALQNPEIRNVIKRIIDENQSPNVNNFPMRNGPR